METGQEKDAMAKTVSLTPMAVGIVERILRNPKAGVYTQIAAIELILDRTYGKPEGTLKVGDGERSIEESAGRIRTMVETIQKRREMEK